MVSIIGEKNLIFYRFYRSIGLRFFFLMVTIDVINVFCRQSIIGIDPIDVFLTIGAQLWTPYHYECRARGWQRSWQLSRRTDSRWCWCHMRTLSGSCLHWRERQYYFRQLWRFRGRWGAGWLGGNSVEGEGCKKQPSSCRICLFLAITAARVLAGSPHCRLLSFS